MRTSKKYALVTGASMGLGRCFALELARRGIDTILVSLPGERLQEVADECNRMGVDSHIYETDITQKEGLMQMIEWVNSRFDVFMLINNAGTGGTRSFLECDTDYIERIIYLNIMATSIITHQLLPNLLEQENAYILNVSSMASFSPIGYKTVYPASKRFVQYFTLGLSEELEGHNIAVSVVHPGPMKTNQDVSRRIEKQGFIGRITSMEPEKVARQSISNLLRKSRKILPGFANKVYWCVLKVIPVHIKSHLLTRAIARELYS